MTPRLYLDEDVLPDLAALLRAKGYDVVSAQERGAFKLTDDAQLEAACGDRRTLLTYNYRDFLDRAREWSAQGRSHFGIVISYRQYGRKRLGEAMRVVESVLQAISAEGLTDAVIVLDDFRGLHPGASVLQRMRFFAVLHTAVMNRPSVASFDR